MPKTTVHEGGSIFEEPADPATQDKPTEETDEKPPAKKAVKSTSK